MSYILDALRRAEAERERGNVPGLHAQAIGPGVGPGTGPEAATPRWMLPAFAALIVAVVLLGWRPWASDPPAGDGPAPPVPPGATTVPSTALPPASPSAVPLPGPTGRVAAPAPTRPSESASRRPAVVSTSVAPANRPRAASAASAAVAAAPASASGVPGDDKVWAFADLPPEVRQQLPAIAIGGSIYSASPASRFVIVNGMLFHEGDTIAPGLVLQQIRLKSAVLSFRGYRYGITF